ncbi:MAG: hypothetical protein AABW63_03820 [Nanoarchaeota archaeon]
MERINKEIKKRVMDAVTKIDNPEYETSWNDRGAPVYKEKSKVKKGRKSRAAGVRFELKVRGNLEDQGWIVGKWTNNVDLEINKLIAVKRRFISRPLGPMHYMGVSSIGTGFPDFIAFKTSGSDYEVMGVEVKINGIISKEEKAKCRFLLNKRIFKNILIARKGKKRGEIEYVDFIEKYGLESNKA